MTAMKMLGLAALGLAAAAGCAHDKHGSATAEAIQLAAGPQLFIDDYLIAEQNGLQRTIHSPVKHPQPVVDGHVDKNFQPYMTVVRDPQTGRFRMWYNASTADQNSNKSHIGYIESADGIHWDRPHRVLKDPSHIQFGASVIDEGPGFAKPAERFKLGYYAHGGLTVAVSPDGLDWTPVNDGKPVWLHDHDITSIHRDPLRNRYIAVGSEIVEGPTWSRRRIPIETVSEDLVNWKKHWQIFTPDTRDEGVTEWYSMSGLTNRGGLWIGLLKVLRDDLNATPGKDAKGMGDMDRKAAGLGYTVLAWSRDGEKWQRDRAPFLDRDHTPGAWDHAHAWADDQLVVGDETFIYYGGYARGHKVERFTERQVGLARMGRDRYVSRDAGASLGTLRTPLIAMPAGYLTVNASVRGKLIVRLVDGRGRYLNISEPVTGDSLAHAVRWRNPAGAGAGRVARLEFNLIDGELYGFEFGAAGAGK